MEWHISMNSSRFKPVNPETWNAYGMSIFAETQLMKDVKTGVVYLIVLTSKGGVGITPLLERSGRPTIEIGLENE